MLRTSIKGRWMCEYFVARKSFFAKPPPICQACESSTHGGTGINGFFLSNTPREWFICHRVTRNSPTPDGADPSSHWECTGCGPEGGQTPTSNDMQERLSYSRRHSPRRSIDGFEAKFCLFSCFLVHYFSAQSSSCLWDLYSTGEMRPESWF